MFKKVLKILWTSPKPHLLRIGLGNYVFLELDLEGLEGYYPQSWWEKQSRGGAFGLVESHGVKGIRLQNIPSLLYAD